MVTVMFSALLHFSDTSFRRLEFCGVRKNSQGLGALLHLLLRSGLLLGSPVCPEDLILTVFCIL